MRIIVGVDQSDGAAAALRWATCTAAVVGASLLVAEAWQYPALPLLAEPDAYAPPEEIDARVESSLREWASTVTDGSGAAQFTALRGDGARALATAAESPPPADLLVVGTRGSGGLDRRLLGSVSRRLTEVAPCPVVVVPEGADEGDGPFLVGVDGTPDSDAAFDSAAMLAECSSTELLVVHCVEPRTGQAGDPLERGREFGEQLLRSRAAELERRGVRHRTILSFESPRRFLAATASEVAARLVLVGARGAGGVERLLLGSVSSHLSASSDRAVAVVHRN